MTEPATVAQETLRGDILAVGVDDYVSLADVQALITDGGLADSKEQRQALVVATVRSLLEDELVVVGVIPGQGDPGFKSWPGTVDEVMARFISLFVDQYEDRMVWEYAIWMNLTEKGEIAGRAELPV